MEDTRKKGRTHLCVEPEADTHLPRLTAVALGGMQVSAEAWQRDGGPTVRQEHVSGSWRDDGVCHWP